MNKVSFGNVLSARRSSARSFLVVVGLNVFVNAWSSSNTMKTSGNTVSFFQFDLFEWCGLPSRSRSLFKASRKVDLSTLTDKSSFGIFFKILTMG